MLRQSLSVAPPPLGTLTQARGSVDAFFDAEFAVTGFTTAANVTGWAAVTLPLGEVGGLPVGVQLMAPGEAVLLWVAAQLEQAMPWADRPPPSSPTRSANAARHDEARREGWRPRLMSDFTLSGR